MNGKPAPIPPCGPPTWTAGRARQVRGAECVAQEGEIRIGGIELKRLGKRTYRILSEETTHGVSEEVEPVGWQSRQSGLLLIHRQAEPVHQVPHRLQRSLSVARWAQDHKIVSIVDHLGTLLRCITMTGPCQHETSEVQVGQQRRDDAALGRAFQYRCVEPLPNHRQQRAIGNAPSDTAHQVAVRNGLEVVGQIRVDYLACTPLDNAKVDVAQRHLRVQTRARAADVTL